MNRPTLSKLNWRNLLGTLAIGWGAINYAELPAVATPIEDIQQLAQVGVQSRVNPPTPLNLRPRVHFSSPSDSSSSSYYPSHSHPIYNRRSHGRYGNYRRHNRHHHHEHSRNNRHRSRGKVIIISPGSHNGVSNYGRDSFIRVIRSY